MKTKLLKIRAIRSTQGNNQKIYSFFLPGALISEIADISRINRNENENLEGFQRKEIKNHVNSIVEYLDQGDVLFPNAITLGISPEVKFSQARGQEPDGILATGVIGTLSLPILEESKRVAWIVDGQQRSMALAKTKNQDILVPVVAFEAKSLEDLRDQFIRLNKGKPLPKNLINELLPEVDRQLPKDLAKRKIPSVLCNLLNSDPASPFHRVIKRSSTEGEVTAVITDTTIMDMIANSLGSPLGILSQYGSLGESAADVDAMYETLVDYWSIVKKVFPQAWGLKATQSRLMHGAGIKAMGLMMDRLMMRYSQEVDPTKNVKKALIAIEPLCCWTEGRWQDLDKEWNDIQNVNKDIKALSDQLTRLDFDAQKKYR